MLPKPVSFEPKDEVLPGKAIRTNVGIFFADPVLDGFEQKSAALANSHLCPEGVIAPSFFVISSDIFDDADLAFAIENTSEVAELQIGKHNELHNGV